MADDLVNRTAAIMMPQFKKDWEDAVVRKRVEWFALQRAGCIRKNMGGSRIEWRARLEEETPFAFSGGMEGHTPEVVNPWQTAYVGWRGMAHAFAITYAEKRLCTTDVQIIDLLKGLREIMVDEWMKEFQTQFYSNGSRLSNSAFYGLGNHTTTSPQTWANISQSSYTNWDAQRIDATGFTGRPVEFIDQLITACTVGNKGGRDRSEPDLLIGTSTDWLATKAHEAVKMRYEQDTELAQAGFKNIAVSGVPFVYSEGCTSGSLFCLNFKNFEFQVAGPDAVETGTQDTIGFPPLTLGYAYALHQMINKNPRGSGLLYNTTS